MSISSKQVRSTKSRPYTMRRRAEQVDQTRLRITEAAVRLHTTVGPAATSIAAVADEAGVTRVTVYRHFSDLDSLFEACAAHWTAQNPPPDPAAWSTIPELEARATLAFGQLYAWYRGHADELHPIYRDMEAMPRSAQRAREAANRELARALIGDQASPETDLADGGRLLRAVARHLVHFSTWRSLAILQGLDHRETIQVAVRLLTATAS
jgi:AcrR family transcriptional regulator